MDINIKWSPTKNFSKGRKGVKPIAIINHITSGQFPGCLNWLQNPASSASAHYIVSRDGRIFQLVKDEDSAWHAKANKPSWRLYNGTGVNRYTLGIEHEGYGSQGGNGALTEAQYQATLQLHKHLMKKHNIPADKDHIIGHYMTDSVNRPNCPGPSFPWDRLFEDLTLRRSVKILVSGKILTGLILDDNLTYVPVRPFGDALGAPVVWDSSTKTVTIGGLAIKTTLIDGVSYSAVRSIAERLGKKVLWDGKQVVIE